VFCLLGKLEVEGVEGHKDSEQWREVTLLAGDVKGGLSLNKFLVGLDRTKVGLSNEPSANFLGGDIGATLIGRKCVSSESMELLLSVLGHRDKFVVTALLPSSGLVKGEDSTSV